MQARASGLLILWLLISAAACSRNAAVDLPDAQPAPAPVYRCGAGGFLEAELVGAVSASLEWNADVLACEGMPRPQERGARLRFAGPGLQPGQTLAVIIAMPDLERGATGPEFATNATVMVEGSGRFFSTSGDEVCWTDIVRQEPLTADRYAIAGSLYCIAPLVEINGDSSVTIAELSFSGLVDWSAS